MKKILESRSAAVSFLTLITAIWGWSFVVVKESVSVYPVFSFLAVRFMLGALVLFLFIRSRVLSFDRRTVLSGAALGAFLFGGYAFQTTGLLYTTPSHSGFITGLFVVFTPLFEALIFRKRPSFAILASLALSTSGLFVLSYDPGMAGVNLGDVLSFFCAVIYSFHLILTDRFSKKLNTLDLAFIQVLTVSLLAFAAAAITGSRLVPVHETALRGAVLTALLATAFSYYVQTTYQRVTTATQAALIFTLEPIFAGIFAYFMWNEAFGGRIFLGGALIFAGMITSQARYLSNRKGVGEAVDEREI